MPIDIMSPIQALQHSAMAYKGVKESEKHLELQKQKLDIDKQNANSKAKVADAKSKEAEAKQTRANKMPTAQEQIILAQEKTKQSRADARKEKSRTELAKTQNMQYNPNNPNMSDKAQSYLAITQDGIRNNQGKGSE